MTDVTIIDLAKLVAEMRDLQRRFFKQHDFSILSRCKQLEKQVDDTCDEILDKQPKLF